jgi:succinate dehydrogenase/fumarate reductase cytochrome b subunit
MVEDEHNDATQLENTDRSTIFYCIYYSVFYHSLLGIRQQLQIGWTEFFL